MNSPSHNAEHCTHNADESWPHELFEFVRFDEDYYWQVCDNVEKETDHTLSRGTGAGEY
jgi:hypothetical protein